MPYDETKLFLIRIIIDFALAKNSKYWSKKPSNSNPFAKIGEANSKKYNDFC